MALARLPAPEAVAIPWPSLAHQFGCGDANPRHFKKRFLGCLRSGRRERIGRGL